MRSSRLGRSSGRTARTSGSSHTRRSRRSRPAIWPRFSGARSGSRPTAAERSAAAREPLEDVLLTALHRPVVIRAEERPQKRRQLLDPGLVDDRAPVELGDRVPALAVEPPLARALEVADEA